MAQNYIGVDLSSDWIDIHDPLRGTFRIANSNAALARWMGSFAPEDFLVFEATSGCDRAILQEAEARGIAMRRINPLHGWHFARSLNLPKTDRVDARMLARFGAERQPEPQAASSPARRELAELETRREQLKVMEGQEKSRLRKATLEAVRGDHLTMLRSLAARRAKIEAHIRDHLKAHPDLARTAHLLQSIPGIGIVAATVLIAHLPELGRIDRRAIASLAGLAPKARESGKWRGNRPIGDGRRHIRRALYMAALSALRSRSCFAQAVSALRAKGKPGKVIAIAMARKLLVIANAIICKQEPFRSAKQ